MPEIQLLIDDAALRSAILEQMTISTMVAKVCRVDDLPSILATGNDVVVLDDASASKDVVKLLQAAGDAGKGRVILLGALAEATTCPAVAESLAKPFRLGQLLSRLQFYMNVVTRQRSAPILFAGYRMEPQTRQVFVDGSDDIIRLTEKEFAILDYLAQCTEPVGREDLLAAIWGYDDRIDTHTLETHIYQLRRKLDPEAKRGDVLVHESGGYSLKKG